MNNNAFEVHVKLVKLQWLMHRQHIQDAAHRGPVADTTRGQGRIIALLLHHDKISTKELSHLLGIRQQSLNELLNKLEKRDYIVRIPLESDKRIMLVTLTDKGRNAQAASKPYFQRMFAGFNEQELSFFGEYLNRLISALEDELDIDGSIYNRTEFMRDIHTQADHKDSIHPIFPFNTK